MKPCTSCKNKTSMSRCLNSALIGSSFCGTHIRTKNPRIWAIVNNVDKRLKLIIKIWRGYYVRKRLKLAGPGVLKRSICKNDEDVGTLDEKEKVSPFDYFGFEEDSNVYWAHVQSMVSILNSNRVPLNPYTRKEISNEARRRLRQIYNYRIRNNINVSFAENNPTTVDQLISKRWMQISQTIYENYFTEINPLQFEVLSRDELGEFLTYILEDTHYWAIQHTSKDSKRYKYYAFIRYGITEFYKIFDVKQYAYIVSTLLYFILADCNDSYEFSFIILSAFNKL